MSELKKNVAAGLDMASTTVGLTGLVPLRIVTGAPVTLRSTPGTLRIQIDLAAGDELRPATPIQVRIYGGDAGLDFERAGQIQSLNPARMPIEIPYRQRVFPEPPGRGQLSVDLSFRHRKADGWEIQDVQWRQPVVWDKRGGTAIELRFAPEAGADATP